MTRLAAPILILATAIWVALFAIMWGPYYVAGIQGQLFLYPLIFLVDAAVILAAVVAIVMAAISARRNPDEGRPALIIWGSLLLILLGPIALWFGGALKFY